jgi:hypothetical protein
LSEHALASLRGTPPVYDIEDNGRPQS